MPQPRPRCASRGLAAIRARLFPLSPLLCGRTCWSECSGRRSVLLRPALSALVPVSSARPSSSCRRAALESVSLKSALFSHSRWHSYVGAGFGVRGEPRGAGAHARCLSRLAIGRSGVMSGDVLGCHDGGHSWVGEEIPLVPAEGGWGCCQVPPVTRTNFLRDFVVPDVTEPRLRQCPGPAPRASWEDMTLHVVSEGGSAGPLLSVRFPA